MAKLTEPKLVQMSGEMLKAIEELADRRGLSASGVIREAVSKFLEAERE